MKKYIYKELKRFTNRNEAQEFVRHQIFEDTRCEDQDDFDNWVFVNKVMLNGSHPYYIFRNQRFDDDGDIIKESDCFRVVIRIESYI